MSSYGVFVKFSSSFSVPCHVKGWGDPATSANSVPASFVVTADSGASKAAGSSLLSAVILSIQTVIPSTARSSRNRSCDEDRDSPAMRFRTCGELFCTWLDIPRAPADVSGARTTGDTHGASAAFIALAAFNSVLSILLAADYMSRF